jgi:(p)ppGpp synthase/HD superfamily hydrolase
MFRFERFHEAVDYAAEAHQHQRRKGTQIPYLSHVLGVASLAMEFGGDEDQAIAALLHDVLEDCGAEHEAPIRQRFGDRVGDMVVACTDGTPDASGRKADWKTRKSAYLEHLEHATPDTLLVSACDKLHNARAIAADVATGQDVFSRFKAGRDQTLWYYRALAEVFGRRLGARAGVVVELDAAIARMQAPPDG